MRARREVSCQLKPWSLSLFKCTKKSKTRSGNSQRKPDYRWGKPSRSQCLKKHPGADPRCSSPFAAGLTTNTYLEWIRGWLVTLETPVVKSNYESVSTAPSTSPPHLPWSCPTPSPPLPHDSGDMHCLVWSVWGPSPFSTCWHSSLRLVKVKVITFLFPWRTL